MVLALKVPDEDQYVDEYLDETQMNKTIHDKQMHHLAKSHHVSQSMLEL